MSICGGPAWRETVYCDTLAPGNYRLLPWRTTMRRLGITVFALTLAPLFASAAQSAPTPVVAADCRTPSDLRTDGAAWSF
jgi:hypothetical protein